ncbi:MAG: hypothetical protein ACT4QE_00165, partial [Anaerolineales bacterium]
MLKREIKKEFIGVDGAGQKVMNGIDDMTAECVNRREPTKEPPSDVSGAPAETVLRLAQFSPQQQLGLRLLHSLRVGRNLLTEGEIDTMELVIFARQPPLALLVRA